ncbi:MAG: hypothetical protein IPI65_15585 [Bacteroidetes bacterium]|nr:hypothetical protein [Bacteroidota bacterium]
MMQIIPGANKVLLLTFGLVFNKYIKEINWTCFTVELQQQTEVPQPERLFLRKYGL